MKRLFAATAALGVCAVLTCGAALAQAPAPAPAPATLENAAPTAALSKAERAQKSKECSKAADAKGLHGKARKRFRDDCKHGKTEADPQ